MEIFPSSGIAASPHYLMRSLSCVLRMDSRLVERRIAMSVIDTADITHDARRTKEWRLAPASWTITFQSLAHARFGAATKLSAFPYLIADSTCISSEKQVREKRRFFAISSFNISPQATASV